MTSHHQVFLDTAQLIGEMVEQDQWHPAAMKAADATADWQRVTSEGVFQEFLAHFARTRSEVRASAAAKVREFRAESRLVVVRHNPALLDAALDLYEGEFLHTRLSYQDCIAIQIMRRLGITEILTADQEFAIAGFTPLMRRFL